MVLRQVSDGPARHGIAGIASENESAAAVGPHRRKQRLDEGRFAGAVRPEQAEDDPFGNPQGNAINGPNLAARPSRAVDLCEILGFDGVLGIHLH